MLDGISLSLPPNYAKGLKKPLAARRGNPFWVNVGCHEMRRALCGNASAKPTGASIGPLPRLWMHRPQSVREHLCFIPFCVMGAKLPPWMSGVGGGGGFGRSGAFGHLTWKVICGKAQCACWKQKTGPETRVLATEALLGEMIQKTLQMRWSLSERPSKNNSCLWQESERLAWLLYLDFRSCRWLSWRFDLLLCNVSTGGIKFSEVVPSI